MADFKSDVLGEATGNAGASCFYRWRGKAYVRARMIARGNAGASSKQLRQQAQFAFVNKVIKGMGGEWCKFGFPSPPVGQTSRSISTKANYDYFERRGSFDLENENILIPMAPSIVASASQFYWEDSVRGTYTASSKTWAISWNINLDRIADDFSVMFGIFGEVAGASGEYTASLMVLDYASENNNIDASHIVNKIKPEFQTGAYIWLYDSKKRQASQAIFLGA